MESTLLCFIVLFLSGVLALWEERHEPRLASKPDDPPPALPVVPFAEYVEIKSTFPDAGDGMESVEGERLEVIRRRVDADSVTSATHPITLEITEQ